MSIMADMQLLFVFVIIIELCLFCILLESRPQRISGPSNYRGRNLSQLVVL